MDASQRICPNCGKPINIRSWCLTDMKLWGSFKVAKALGITRIGSKPDPSGARYKTTSKWGKAGEPKMVSVFAQLPGNADNWEVELQLNRYRVMLEDLGVKVARLQVQATVRDGGLSIATSRGLERNCYRIPVRLLDNTTVREYFKYKADCLTSALALNSWGEPCSDRECWDGVRCANYCDVKEHCPKGSAIGKKETLDE